MLIIAALLASPLTGRLSAAPADSSQQDPGTGAAASPIRLSLQRWSDR
ncbi:hypothetical protein ACPPVO_36190 [Dactylosporangium sp. McL0621]